MHVVIKLKCSPQHYAKNFRISSQAEMFFMMYAVSDLGFGILFLRRDAELINVCHIAIFSCIKAYIH